MMAEPITSPMYETVVKQLQIDPEQIAARPRWSLKVAKKLRKHRQKRQQQVTTGA